jgi:hypothetical protein
MPVRERKEVQEMLRSLMILVAAGMAAASAPNTAVWPDEAPGYKKIASRPAQPPEQEIFKEFGFEAGEQATFSTASGRVTATAYRFTDSTGAFGAYELLRASSPKETVQAGNYVIRFSGAPDAKLAEALAAQPGTDHRPLPTLTSYLPEAGLAPGSERFLLGPAGLARFVPNVPAEAAAFQYGTEVAVARYNLPNGAVNLALFSYPNPQIALQQFEVFQKIPGAMAKRTGPLVALLLAPPDPDQAERLLAAVNYRAEVTWNQKPPDPKDDVADVLITIILLTALIMSLFIAAGVVVGLLRRWYTATDTSDPMIMLHLEDK